MEGFNYPLQQSALLSQWMSEYSHDGSSDFNLDRTLYRASAASMDKLIEVREFFDVLSEVSPLPALASEYIMLISFVQTIRMGMHDRCQNRPRQHRLCALAAQRWEDLGSSLPLLDILDECEKAQLSRGISARRADVLLDALLEEFDLELVDRKEWSSVYWYLSRVARARTTEGRQSRSWRAFWASGWANVAEALHMVSVPG